MYVRYVVFNREGKERTSFLQLLLWVDRSPVEKAPKRPPSNHCHVAAQCLLCSSTTVGSLLGSGDREDANKRHFFNKLTIGEKRMSALFKGIAPSHICHRFLSISICVRNMCVSINSFGVYLSTRKPGFSVNKQINVICINAENPKFKVVGQRDMYKVP